MIIINKEKFRMFENVRKSGITNMFDLKVVKELTGLSKDEIVNIIKNYSKYNKKFGGK
jgi:hypothetical protein